MTDDAGFRDVDDVTAPADQPVAPGRSAKLQRAKVVAKKTEEELGALCRGLNDKIAELGIEIKRANEHRGVEVALHVLGAAGWDWAEAKANKLRRERLQQFNTQEAVAEIGEIVVATIKELGESENEYEDDQRAYETQLNEILKKQTEATPLYSDAVARREKADAKIETLERTLKDCTLDQRPILERKFEMAKREQDAAQLDEATYLAVVKNAQEAIPELQKSRDAAAHSIQALHGMRQSMLEKFADFKIVLERATTAMRARAHIELFEDADPAFNAAITAITANNVATAGAALEVWTERIKQAAISPQRSQELLQELLQHVLDATTSLTETEEAVATGPRKETLLLTDQRIPFPDMTERELEPAVVRHTREMERARTGEAPAPKPRRKK